MPLLARPWSAGLLILVSTMVAIFALVFGALLLYPERGWEEDGWGADMSTHALDPLYQQGMEFYRSGELARARLAFTECSIPLCDYFLLEMEMPASRENLHQSATVAGNADSQYLLGTFLSNEFSNLTVYTSSSFAEGVLYMYAASTASHPGALMAMGYRHLHGYGVPKRCETAALNYLEVAKPVANIYANSIPRAVELIRLNVEKDKKILSISEISLFTEVANSSPDIAQAVGRRFLLGTDGFPQDYVQAVKFLSLAAAIGDDPAAYALLGYVHALGLGVPVDQGTAESFFEKGIADGLAMNGLGYLRFQSERFAESFEMFNKSAVAGSADGMFNLASLFLTGTGTLQNFQKAFMWFTEALRRGHTPAGYALAVMHLNGIGTVRDCQLAVNLLKEVAERGEWVGATLRAAYSQMAAGEVELGALQLLKLAEAGHQVSQENLAHLIDSKKVKHLFGMHALPPELHPVFAQRFYELAAAQGSVSSELRLGDFAYSGLGLRASLEEAEDEVVIVHALMHADPQAAFRKYQSTREKAAQVAALTGANTPEWLSKIAGTAEFNLGWMYWSGLGVRPNVPEAASHFRRALPASMHGRGLVLWLIDLLVARDEQILETNPPPPPALESYWTILRDFRLLFLMLLVWVFVILVYLRA